MRPTRSSGWCPSASTSLRSILGWVERFSEAAEEDRAPGAGLTTLRLGDATVGPLISYESTFPDMRRLAWVDQDETGAWTVVVTLSQEETLFVRWRDWVPAACFVVVVVAALAACVPVGHWRKHRAPSRPVAKGAP